MSILDAYVLKKPHPQNVIDLFAGEWSTAMPPSSGLISKPGPNPLFETPHLRRAEHLLGGFAGKTVLELGPLEGGHSHMLHTGGAKRVVSIEANSRAYLKCLCVKELFKLSSVEYHLGDFMAYLADTQERFDLTVASGVLYHMSEPLKLLDLICAHTDHVSLWTHYYDEKVLTANPKLAPKFSGLQAGNYEGFDYQWALQSYNEALNWAGFCGGTEPTSVWLPRQTILDFLASRGLTHQSVSFDWPEHPHGPSYAIAASRRPLFTALDFLPESMLCGAWTLHPSVGQMSDDQWLLHLRATHGDGSAAGGKLHVAAQVGPVLWLAQGSISAPRWTPIDDVDATQVPALTRLAHDGDVTLSLPRQINGQAVSGVYLGIGDTLAYVLEGQQHIWIPT